MKKFQFTLEPVLQQRAKKEQEALVVKARADMLYQERLQALEQTEQTLNQSLNAYTHNPMGELHRIMYQEHLRCKISQQAQLVQQAKQKADQAWQASMTARQERMVMEKLKERRLEEHRYTNQVLEAKETDEMATAMFNRKQHPTG